MAVRVHGVVKGSFAWKEGIEEGDSVLEVNGIPVEDLLDLNYLTASPPSEIRIIKKDGKRKRVLYTGGGDPLGIIPEPVKVKRCKNRCIFCFVHQLPRGLRQSLYVKDEDYRLSFLSGNFVTLSDLTDEELGKIVRYRLSPLYVSVHTVDNDLRRKMLGNPAARDIRELLAVLTEAGIQVHTQVVLCPGINDGDKLDETVSYLWSLYPGVSSLAVVPVGLTAHRQKLPPLKPVTKQIAEEVVTFVEERARKFRKETGWDFVFASDEFYILSGKKIPSRKRYGDYPQIENGVGLLRQFLESWRKLERRKLERLDGISAVVPTGRLVYPYIREFLLFYGQKTGARISAVPVRNTLFGDSVTVTGLLPGRDVLKSVMGRREEHLLIPSVMLREVGDRFLDDLTPQDLERETGKKVVVFEPDPEKFHRAVSQHRVL